MGNSQNRENKYIDYKIQDIIQDSDFPLTEESSVYEVETFFNDFKGGIYLDLFRGMNGAQVLNLSQEDISNLLHQVFLPDLCSVLSEGKRKREESDIGGDKDVKKRKIIEGSIIMEEGTNTDQGATMQEGSNTDQGATIQEGSNTDQDATIQEGSNTDQGVTIQEGSNTDQGVTIQEGSNTDQGGKHKILPVDKQVKEELVTPNMSEVHSKETSRVGKDQIKNETPSNSSNKAKPVKEDNLPQPQKQEEKKIKKQKENDSSTIKIKRDAKGKTYEIRSKNTQVKLGQFKIQIRAPSLFPQNKVAKYFIVEPSTGIVHLKLHVCNHLKVSQENLIFTHNGRELINGTVSDNGLDKESIIIVTRKPINKRIKRSKK